MGKVIPEVNSKELLIMNVSSTGNFHESITIVNFLLGICLSIIKSKTLNIKSAKIDIHLFSLLITYFINIIFSYKSIILQQSFVYFLIHVYDNIKPLLLNNL